MVNSYVINNCTYNTILFIYLYFGIFRIFICIISNNRYKNNFKLGDMK